MTDAPTVVLLHGLARTDRSMGRLRRSLERAGHPTWSRSYPSRRMPVAALAATIAEWIRADLGDRPVIGVTHSLGGIVARHMRELLPWRGVVMVAPPNAGSRVAARLRHRPLYRWFYGPAGQELGEPDAWPSPPSPFAVIAGTRGLAATNPTSWVTSALQLFPPGVANDGTIAVTETRLPGMVDFATVDATHTWIMNDARTIELVLAFLARGRFGAA
ncbi:MAG TPA: alpha/beta fold hydrolase [Haliangiales bacterium]|nr:alpha/beta fold hydrolase [Haliangiales bacterium]